MTKKNLIKGIALASCAAFAAACSSQGNAVDASHYPTGTVRIVVSYPAGGPTDLAARAIAPCLEDELGGTFIVENQDGGSGTVALRNLAKGKADGSKLLIAALGNTVVAPMLEPSVGYTVSDFKLIGGIYEMPSVIVVPADSKIKTAADLFAQAKSDPGSIKMGTPGSKVFDAEIAFINDTYGVEFGTVPFQGTSEALTSLLGGNIDALFVDASAPVMAQVDAGKVRALAVGSAQELDYLKGVPTLASLGYEKADHTMNPFALAAPAKTPRDIVSKLEGALKTCSTSKKVGKVYGEQYQPDTFITPDAVANRFSQVKELLSDSES